MWKRIDNFRVHLRMRLLMGGPEVLRHDRHGLEIGAVELYS